MRIAVALSIFFLMSCCSTLAKSNPPGTRQDVNLCDLAHDPSAFSGKRIRVRAIYRYDFEMQSLASPACCPVAPPDIAVVVQVAAEEEGKFPQVFRRFQKHGGLLLATFTGTFEAGGPYGNLAYRYRLTVDHVEKVERTARLSSKQADPAWVQKNCGASGTGRPTSSSTSLHELLPRRQRILRGIE